MAAIWLFLKAIDPRIWIGIGIAIAVSIAAWKLYDAIGDAREVKVEARWQAKYDARERDWLEQARAHKAKLDAMLVEAKADAAKRETELLAKIEELGKAHRAAVNKLNSERANYVTPDAVRRCDLSYGFILYRNRAAAAANGDNAAAGLAPPARELADAPSGVALDSVADTWADDLAILGECRTKVKAHELHLESLEAWYEGVRSRLAQ